MQVGLARSVPVDLTDRDWLVACEASYPKVFRALVGNYATLLHEGGQTETAAATRALLDDPAAHFRVVRPGADIVDQTISTE